MIHIKRILFCVALLASVLLVGCVSPNLLMYKFGSFHKHMAQQSMLLPADTQVLRNAFGWSLADYMVLRQPGYIGDADGYRFGHTVIGYHITLVPFIRRMHGLSNIELEARQEASAAEIHEQKNIMPVRDIGVTPLAEDLFMQGYGYQGVRTQNIKGYYAYMTVDDVRYSVEFILKEDATMDEACTALFAQQASTYLGALLAKDDA